MELETVNQHLNDLRLLLGKEVKSFVVTGDRVELEGYDSVAEIHLNENKALCMGGAFINLPQGLFLRDAEYSLGDYRALSDTRGRIKRINYRINAKSSIAENWVDTLGLQFGKENGVNVFDVSDSTADVVVALGAMLVGRLNKAGRCSLTHQIDIDYPQPLISRPCAFRFRSIVSKHGILIYSQDITIKNI